MDCPLKAHILLAFEKPLSKELMGSEEVQLLLCFSCKVFIWFRLKKTGQIIYEAMSVYHFHACDWSDYQTLSNFRHFLGSNEDQA